MTATIAIAVVAMMVFAAAGATTFSWFTDTEETDITITTGSLDVETKGFYVNTDGNELTDGDVLPDNISIIYDDGRSATDAWKDVNTISIAGNPVDANIEIGYEVTFTADIDYKYLIDVVVPEQIHVDVTVIKKGDVSKTNIGYGLWKFPAVEPSEEFSATYDVKIVIKSIPMGLVDTNIKIVNKITQYLDTTEHPIDTWDGTYPSSKPDNLVVDHTKRTITVNDAEGFAYLNTLLNDSEFRNSCKSTWFYSIELNANINLNNKEWTPIVLDSYGAFNGNGNSIYNLKVETGNNAGLFATLYNDDNGILVVKDFNIINAVVSGDHYVGVVSGSSPQGQVINVTVDNAEVIGKKYVGGIFGHGNGSVNDCTVMNSSITIPEDGIKEAGGLIGYLANDGKTSSNKIISGNHVENVVISAPTVASGLVSQSNSANIHGALIEIKDNTMVNVIIETADDTGRYYVSNNVNDRSVIADDSDESNDCELRHKVATVSNTDKLKEVLGSGANYVHLDKNTYTFPTSALKEDVILDCDEGVVFEGNSKLNIKGATIIGATFSNPSGTAVDQTINGVFKNCTFTGSNALRWCYAGETVVFENCTFTGDLYGVHFDGGANEVVFKNCTLSGFNAMGGAITKLTMEGCTFKPGVSGYNGINCWGSTEMKGCTFIFDGTKTEWIDMCGSNTVGTFTGCIVSDGTTERPLSASDIGDYGSGNTITVSNGA